MDRIYGNFVDRVAAGRHLSPDRVRDIAKGRVWTGAQAVQLGLVDKLGGLGLAVGEAKRLSGIATGQSVSLRVMPSKKSPFDALQRAFGRSDASVRSLTIIASLLSDARAQTLLDALVRTQVQAQGGAAVLAPRALH